MKRLLLLSLLLPSISFGQLIISPGSSGGSGDALTTGTLGQFAATTSSQFKGVISDENAPDGASSKVIMALGSLSIATGKTATVSNTLTLAGTDATVMTFPTTSATIARTDAAQTFTGVQTFTAPVLGTPTSATLTNATGLPVAGITASTATALGVGSVELGAASDTTIARSGAGAVTVEGVAVPTISSTSTLTNKRVNPRSQDNNAAASPQAPDSDSYDFVIYRGIGAAFTINAPTGTPVAGQKLMLRLTDDGTARALTWQTGSSGYFRASSDLALPTTTTVNKTMYLGFIWNVVSSRWDLLAKLDNF